MTPRIKAIVHGLGVFGSDANSSHVDKLTEIARTTKNSTERDQAIELLLYCDANENGPLGMVQRAEILERFTRKDH